MTASNIRQLFVEHGVRGPIRVAVPLDADEAVFVISGVGAATMDQVGLTAALMSLLGRKVWIATDGPEWAGRTTPLA